MSNVIAFRPQNAQSTQDRVGRLIEGFAEGRSPKDDVFWLKENAELLGILKAKGAQLSAEALAPYAAFYDQIEARLRFFPQYYRFLLSMCLDLEDLGMPGDKGAGLCAWASAEGLPEAELSDLQRAEARRLVARRGITGPSDPELDQRLHAFIGRNVTFSLPNKKAAYELTHIVFYLSEYGQRDPGLRPDAITSLQYAGLLAYLDQNADLLAEVCTALLFAGVTPSALWDQMVARCHGQVQLSEDGQGALNDAYHVYLVTGWALQVQGRNGFQAEVPAGQLRFATTPGATQGALRTLSECMFDLGDLRSRDWQKMRGHVMPYLGTQGQQVLQDAEQSTELFDDFFAGFARAGAV